MIRKYRDALLIFPVLSGIRAIAGQIPYTMEKAALDAFTKSLAQELWGTKYSG